ncbi:hypothetical protein A2U01_0081649 [Trifolium medium]|uniref:Uncharacterized protein n=1 Tax=Trifolium medium TaxID=97028 RepID=A0A392TGY9_9FABA|nr:hypothetical protein [Trifolium medium]
MASSKALGVEIGQILPSGASRPGGLRLARPVYCLRRFSPCHLRAAPGQAAPRAGTVHRIDFC